MVVTLTGGERGDILNPAMDLPEVHGRMAEIRRDEMAKAAEILGVEHHWLGFVDSGLPEGDPPPPLPDGCFGVVPLEEPDRGAGAGGPQVQAARDDHLRRERRLPASGPHPLPQVSVAAYEAAGDFRRFPDAGEPWDVPKLYYNHGFLRKRMQLLQDEFAKHGQEGPFEKWLKHWDPDHDVFENRVTTRIECAKYFAQRDDALRAHATQIDPNGDFFRAPIEWQQRLWPTEEYELARSRVPVSLPETDLFAGIETTGERRDVMLVVGLLADDAPRDTGPDFGKASPFGLVIVVLLLVGTFLLVRSMNRHLRKLPESFDDEHRPDHRATTGASGADRADSRPSARSDRRPNRSRGG